MANRIMLNQTSYHGAGAIAEIATEAKAHGFKKALDAIPDRRDNRLYGIHHGFDRALYRVPCCG